MHEITSRLVARFARHLRLLLNRGILNVGQLRFRFHSVGAAKSTIHLDPKFGNLFHAQPYPRILRIAQTHHLNRITESGKLVFDGLGLSVFKAMAQENCACARKPFFASIRLVVFTLAHSAVDLKTWFL